MSSLSEATSHSWMDKKWKTVIWQQFGAAIDMLENALDVCPDKFWSDRSKQLEFWYVAYHAIFWLDFYLSDSADDFSPPAPFTLSELDPAGIRPERVYTKEELPTYLEHGRTKCWQRIEALTDESTARRFKPGRIDPGIAELLLYNMRHVQHHYAQLNLVLRHAVDTVPLCVVHTKK